MLRQESRCTHRKHASDEGETIKRGRTLYYTEIKPVSDEGETIKYDTTPQFKI